MLCIGTPSWYGYYCDYWIVIIRICMSLEIPCTAWNLCGYSTAICLPLQSQTPSNTPSLGSIILKTLMTANFCLSGSMQSTQPGQLNGIMVLFSAKSPFKPPIRRGGSKTKNFSHIYQLVLYSFSQAFDAVGWAWQKSLYCGPHWFQSQCEALKWQSAYGLPELSGRRCLFIRSPHIIYGAGKTRCKALIHPHRALAWEKTGLFLCKTVGLLDVSPSINHA